MMKLQTISKVGFAIGAVGSTIAVAGVLNTIPDSSLIRTLVIGQVVMFVALLVILIEKDIDQSGP